MADRLHFVFELIEQGGQLGSDEVHLRELLISFLVERPAGSLKSYLFSSYKTILSNKKYIFDIVPKTSYQIFFKFIRYDTSTPGERREDMLHKGSGLF